MSGPRASLPAPPANPPRARTARRLAAAIGLGLAIVATGVMTAGADDETSTGDKLRILYSNRFVFTDDGIPLVTIAIAGGEQRAVVSARSGVVVRPDGDGGAELRAGERWEITVEGGRPARTREWTVVARLAPDDEERATAAMRTWRARGFEPRRFETGTIFAVAGDVTDTREVLIAVDPVAAGQGNRRARALRERFDVPTTVHHELTRRPEGTIVARSGEVVVRNPAVIWFAPGADDDTLTVADIEVGGGGSQLETQRETRRYFGAVYATVGQDGRLTLVNAVPADRLLAGLVPAEIFPSAPDAALRAQAIAARTELLHKLGTRHLADPFLVCASQHCQVYAGAGREHPRTTRAVRATRGQVLVRDGGGLVDARYSAACGGHGEHNDVVWGDAPDAVLRGHLDTSAHTAGARPRFADGISSADVEAFLATPPEDSFCGATRFSEGRFRWEKRMTREELERRIRLHYRGAGTLIRIEPTERGISGRITVLRLHTDRGIIEVRGELHIRRLLGGLRSTLFVVDREGPARKPTAFRFRGAGFGHGVGMCQLGAIGMANAGHGHRDILSHYYRSARLRPLY